MIGYHYSLVIPILKLFSHQCWILDSGRLANVKSRRFFGQWKYLPKVEVKAHLPRALSLEQDAWLGT